MTEACRTAVNGTTRFVTSAVQDHWSLEAGTDLDAGTSHPALKYLGKIKANASNIDKI